MGALTAFARAVTTANLWIARVLSWAVLLMFALLLCDVVLRYVAERPMVWTSEIAGLTFGVYAILGGGYLLARRQHVNVDLIYGELSPKRRAAIDIVTSILFFLFVGVLLRESWSMAHDSISRWEVSYQTTFQPPIWPSKALIPVAALLLLLQGVVKLAADVMILMGVEVDETAFGPLRDDEAAQEAV
jgi:TRAP-type mannitol/chloroaromatic compound transport system permease small subunit